MTDIAERLRNRAFAATIIRDKPDLYNEAADEIERLRMGMHDIYEVYAGSDGHPNNTRHPYLMKLIKRMADIAAEHKRVAGGDK